MLTILAVICPPLAVLRAGTFAEAVLSLPLTAMLYVPGVVYALAVVERHRTERRNERLLEAVAVYDAA